MPHPVFKPYATRSGFFIDEDGEGFDGRGGRLSASLPSYVSAGSFVVVSFAVTMRTRILDGKRLLPHLHFIVAKKGAICSGERISLTLRIGFSRFCSPLRVPKKRNAPLENSSGAFRLECW